jgi:hypothetical protein
VTREGGDQTRLDLVSSSISPAISSSALLGSTEALLRSATIPGVASSLTVGSLGVLHNIGGSVVTSDGGGVGRGVASSRAGGSSSGGLSLSSQVVVEAVETLGLGTVEVEPPVADEVVLVEDGSVGTEEAVLGQTTGSVSGADVEDLALSLGVSVVTSVNLAVTRESRLGNLGVDGIVLSGHPGDGFLQHGNVVIRAGRGRGGSLVNILVVSISWLSRSGVV